MFFVLKSDSNPKHVSFFVFNSNVSNKISSTPTRLLHFQEFSNPLVYSNPSLRLLNFEEFSNLPPPTYSNPLPFGTLE